VSFVIVSQVLCLEGIAVRAYGGVNTVDGLYKPINNENQINHLLRLIQEKNNELNIFTQELNELNAKMENFQKSEHNGVTLMEIGVATLNLSNEIEFYNNMIARIRTDNDGYQKMVKDFRRQQATLMPQPSVPERFTNTMTHIGIPSPVVTETRTTTTIDTSVLPSGATQQTGFAEQVEVQVVESDVEKAKKVAEKKKANLKSGDAKDTPKKEGWKTSTKVIMSVLAAAVAISVMVIVLYLQKS